MKRVAAVCLIWVLLAAGCAASGREEQPAPAETALPAPTPAASPASATTEAAVELSPRAVLQALLARRHDGGSTRSFVDCADIAEVLEGYGETEFSSLMRTEEYLSSMLIDAEHLVFEGAYEDNGARVPFAAIFFNNHRMGYCLVMKDIGGWQFGGYFECGEVDNEEDGYAPYPLVRTHSAALPGGGAQTWLLVPGHVNSGTSRAGYDCVWYNLNGGRVDARYITMNLNGGAGPLIYSVDTDVSLDEGPGARLFAVEYRCGFYMSQRAYDEQTADKIDMTLTVEFFCDDGGLYYVVTPSAGETLMTQRDISAGTLLELCYERIRELEKNGTKKQKAWVEELKQLRREQAIARITLTDAQGGRHEVYRYQGTAGAPRFSDFWLMNTTIETECGAPVALSFTEPPGGNYTLTRCGEDGGAEFVPIDNGVFSAHERQGTMLYTLDATWWFGTYSYDFNITALPDGAPALVHNAETVRALSQGRDYLHQITGYDFAASSGQAAPDDATVAPYDDGSPACWKASYMPPRHNVKACLVFDAEGLIRYYCIEMLDAGRETYTALPLEPEPEAVKRMSYEEKARYWFDALPLKKTGELTGIYVLGRNERTMYKGRRVTRLQLNLSDGSLYQFGFEKETGRLTSLMLSVAVENTNR